MAQPATQVRPIRQVSQNASEDSIDAEFGGDYSETSIEALKYLGKKGARWGDIEPSEREALRPPTQAECNAAVARLHEYDQALEQLTNHKPDERERAWVDYKRDLVQGASARDITWLKLKAFHHAMDALRASRGQDAAGNALTQSSQAAPEPPSHLYSTRENVLRAAQELMGCQSSGSEVLEADNVPFFSDPKRTLATLQESPASTSQPEIAGTALLAATSTAPAAATALASIQGLSTATTYNPDYLEEMRLSRQLATQRAQRHQAFMLGAVAALGASVARWWLRRRRGEDAAGGKGSLRRPQPQ